MRSGDYVHRLVQQQLWLVLEGSKFSQQVQSEADAALVQIASTALNFAQSQQPECRIIDGGHQVLWLAARLLRSMRGTEPILLSKGARFESLVSRLDAPDDTLKELRSLNDVVCNSLTQDGKEVALHPAVGRFIQSRLVDGDLDAAIGVINLLLSPYLSHLSVLDSQLLQITQNSLNALLESKGQIDVLLHLLVVSGACQVPVDRLWQLVVDKSVGEHELYLALLARKEPYFVQSLCKLESPSPSEILSTDHNLQARQAFILQNDSGRLWIYYLLEVLAKLPAQTLCTRLQNMEIGSTLLFYLWSTNCCDAKAVIDNLIPMKDPVSQRLISLLQRRCEVMRWVQKQEGLNVEAVSNAIVKLLQKFSTLSVLHQSGALLACSQDKVQILLDKCSRTDDEWEIVTFQGYCILLKAINLFQSASRANNSYSQTKDFKQYQENGLNITEELNRLQSLLKKLYPLNLRLGVLENIFSLMFIRYEHLKTDEVPSDSGGEDEDSLKSQATLTEASISPDLLVQPSLDQVGESSLEEKNLKPSAIAMSLRSGFLCGPLMIRETLAFMRECLVNCSAVLYKQKAETKDDNSLDLQKQISRFTQIVTEAWWRLELVTDISDFIDYEKKSNSFIPQPQKGYFSSASSSDSDREQQEKPRARKTSKKSSRAENADRSSGSGSTSIGGVSGSSGKGKKVGRRKSRALNKIPIETDSIINVLLASPQSLALLCLVRCDYNKAQQIVQAFQLENTEIAMEANFIEIFHSLSAEVLKTPDFSLATVAAREFSSEMSPTNSKMIISSSLEMVRRAASIGVSAVSVTSLVEKILSTAPPVHGMEKLMLENRQASHLLGGISTKVLVSVDCAVTLGISSGASSSLMDVVSQHSNFGSTKAGIKGRSYAHFVTTFMDLFRHLHSKEKCESAATILCTWEVPLSLLILNEYWIIRTNLHKALSEYLSSSSVRIKIGAIRQMIHTLTASRAHCEFKGIQNISVDSLPYLQHLFWYTQTLSFVVSRCDPDNSKDVLNPFEMLNEGWESLLSRLVFQYEAPLGRVERVSNRLNLDLLQAIVGACCPSFSQFETDNNFLLQPAATAWAKVSLNALASQNDSECHPSKLAGEILTELLGALKRSDLILMSECDLPNLACRPEILQVLSKTTKLSCVDLDVLDGIDEKTAFLCNICNLLILHGLLSLGARSGLTSRSWSERRSAFNCIGYHIGQMGFVPLAGLLRQLVGPDFDNSLEAKNSGNLLWNIENKQALFTINHGTIQSPYIQIYQKETLESQLQSATLNYVMQNVKVEGSLSEGCFSLVITPLMLQFLGLSSPQSVDTAVEACDESLPSIPQQYMPVTNLARDCAANIPAILAFLQDNSKGQLHLQLAEWAAAWESSSHESTELIVVVEDPCKKMGVMVQSSMEVFSPDLLQSSSSEQSFLVGNWEASSLSPRVLQYLSKSCWIVALLAERLRSGDQEHQFWPHTESLDRFIGEKLGQLNAFGDSNLMLAALKPPAILLYEIWSILDKFIRDQNDDQCIQLMMSLPESLIFDNVRLQTFRDILLFYAASQSRRHGVETPHRLAMSLGTAELRARCILKSIQYWSGDDSTEALEAILGDPEISKVTRKEVLGALKQVTIYQKVHKVLCYYQPVKTSLSDGWHQILCLSDSEPGQVLQALVEAKQFRLCLRWAELHRVPSKANHLIDCNLVAPLVDSADSANFTAAQNLLESVPTERAVSICRRLLASLMSMWGLQFVVKFSLQSCKSWLEQNPNVWGSLQLWSVGLSILNLLPEQDQIRDRNLASKPHLILEQLLMNTKLAILSDALAVLRSADLCAVPSDHPSQPLAVDAVLRSYANKALDFRVAQRIVPEEAPPELGDLLQSLSTGSTGSGPAPFAMPAVAPTKDGWVPNDEVTECMCCHLVPFSMFNRRHHCRRCGRVVCATCSNRRMKVDGYGELQVRVCDDCFLQMQNETIPEANKYAEPSVHSSQQTYIIEWSLSGDELQDETVREEFSFEHAPSVALCLSILGLHSEHAAAQPRFLLEAAEKMLQMLAPPTPGFVNPELDYSLVIRMARSLVVAAKVRYAKAALNSGVAHCDRLLGQVDLLSLLVKSGCANLLPVEPLPLSGHALRHLRDRLLSAELWSLALEVSTKAGLDRTGVWAAWGKACLRAGKWPEAREHLAHCLQPVTTQDSLPAPLLSEILRILEESSFLADDTLKKSAQLTSPALSVLHTLNSLQAVAQGRLSAAPPRQPAFYAECQHYLRTYGSTAATVSFFLVHSDLVSALRFTIDRAVEPEVFAEALYKPCLVQGLVGKLFAEMRTMDPSLEMWKTTIMHVGRLLEQQGLWNSLYQLQLFSKDLVRAAMTCIRFYKAGARCYLEMNPEHLTKARGHIEDELATNWAASDLRRSSSVNSNRSSESPEAGDSDFQIPLKLPARTLDHNITTISRQLEAAKFLQQCETEERTAVVSVAAVLCKMASPSTGLTNQIPTLFGDNNERILVAALILLCGKNIEEGFGTTFRIIQYFRLKEEKVYILVLEFLLDAKRSRQIPQLVKCIKSSGSADASSCSDQLVIRCIQRLIEQADGLILAEPLLRLVTSTEAKIQSHLICGYLKSAYLLAVKSGRASDVRMILDEAEKQKQPAMIRICQQWLAQNKK